MIPLRHGLGCIGLQPAGAAIRCYYAFADLGQYRLGGSDIHVDLDELEPPGQRRATLLTQWQHPSQPRACSRVKASHSRNHGRICNRFRRR